MLKKLQCREFFDTFEYLLLPGEKDCKNHSSDALCPSKQESKTSVLHVTS